MSRRKPFGPSQPIPEPIYGNEPNSWANSTIAIRVPEIGQRVLAKNQLSEISRFRLEALIKEIPNKPVRQLTDSLAPDADDWKAYVGPYEGESWLDVPWFFAEHYFYRRLLEAVDYFLEPENLDPFAYEKEAGLDRALATLRKFGQNLNRWSHSSGGKEELLHAVLALSLWGNQADLSLWPTDESENSPKPRTDLAIDPILVDDRSRLRQQLTQPGNSLGRIGWVADNAGFELGLDLLVIGTLLRVGLIESCQLLVKAHPTFVSDAISADVTQTVSTFQHHQSQSLVDWGGRLDRFLVSRQLSLEEDFFWTSPLAGWSMPASTYSVLEKFDLVIVKGDMNYRRLLGDRHWNYSTPFESIVEYFPTSMAALRVIKAELASGIPADRVELLSQEDPRWCTSGQWGTIQIYFPNLASKRLEEKS